MVFKHQNINIVVILFLLVSFALNISAVKAQEKVILEEQPKPEIMPLHDIDCPIDYSADGNRGSSIFDRIYSFETCYKKFLQAGKDETICGQFSKEGRTRMTPPAVESKTQNCYFGFAIANQDYKICDNLAFSERGSCYIGVSLISNSIEPCSLLTGGSKNSCFSLVGPISNSAWISWFLSSIWLNIFIALIVFITASFFLKPAYRRELIIFSLIIAFVEFIVASIFSRELTTAKLYFLVLLPTASLFFSAFAIKVFDILLQKTNKSWIVLVISILIGLVHGFLVPIQPLFKAYGSDIFMFSGFLYASIPNSLLLMMLYILFYFWVRKKIQKQYVATSF